MLSKLCGNIIKTSKSRTYLNHYCFNKDVDDVCTFIADKKKLVVLTGAGCSTESGIPDYRGKYGTYKLGHQPMTYQYFIAKHENQQRYWYRSMIGWPSISSKQPSNGHIGIYNLFELGKVFHLITQNVDRLHHKVIPQEKVDLVSNITELHGTIYEVICMNCNNILNRHEFQELLLKLNSHLDLHQEIPRCSDLRPDGDSETILRDYSSFVIPKCKKCDSNTNVLKPNVVFFGENVPAKRVEDLYSIIEKADGLLVIGSTLSVYSSWRFVKRAYQLGVKIGVINQGATRADEIAAFKIEQRVGDVFSEVMKRFGSSYKNYENKSRHSSTTVNSS